MFFINTTFKFHKYYIFAPHIHMRFISLLKKDSDVLTLSVASGVLILKSPSSWATENVILIFGPFTNLLSYQTVYASFKGCSFYSLLCLFFCIWCMLKKFMFLQHSKTLRPKLFFEECQMMHVLHPKWPIVNSAAFVSYKHKKQHQNTENKKSVVNST